MADELKARLSVDTSSFRSGMADAASSTRALKDASQELKVALNDLAEAESELGPAIQNGSEQAIAILGEYKERVASLQAEISGLAAVEEDETVALKSNISARMAATAEIRLAEGGVQGLNRAAAAYLTTLPGVAAAAQAAFAVAGPLALIAVLGQVAQGIGHIVTAYREMTLAKREAEVGRIESGEKVIPAKSSLLSTSTFARVAHGGDITQPDLDVQMFAAKKEELEAERQIAAAQAQYNESGLTGLALQKQRVTDKQAELTLLKQQRAEVEAMAEAYKAQLTATAPTSHRDIFGKRENLLKITDEGQVKAVEDQMRAAEAEVRTLNKDITVGGIQEGAAEKKEPGAADKDEEREAREKLKEIEEKFGELHTKLPEEAAAFWRQYIGTFEEGSKRSGAEYAHVVEQIDKFTDQFEKGLGRQSEIVKKYESESVKLADLNPAEANKSMEEMHKWQVETLEDLTKSGERWHAYAEAQTKAVEISAQNTQALDKVRIAIQQADGELSPLHARMQLAADDAEEYRRKLEALNEEMARLKKEAQGLEPGSPGYSRNQTQQAQLQNQISGLQGQSQVSGAQNNEAIAKQMAQPYITAANDIQNAFTKAFTEVAMRQKTWQQAMAGALVSLELSAAQSAEKWLMKWVDAEILALAKHILGNQQKAASDAEAAAQQQAVQATADAAQQVLITTTNVAEILSYAAVAAAAAAAAAAPGGPPAMAAAAGAAYAEVSSFASLAAFDVGTAYVPKTGIAMIHKGEGIIPAGDNAQIISALRGGGLRGSGGSVRATINNHYNNPGKPPSAREQAAGLRDMIKRGHA